MNPIITKIGRGLSMAKFNFRRRSPEILLVTGVASLVASTVIACVKTPKALEVIELHKIDKELIRDRRDSEHNKENGLYSAEEARNDLIVSNTQMTVKLMKIYATPITMTVGGITCLFLSNGIMRKRNAALAAAYTALDIGFKEYRKRVEAVVGEEKELDIFHNRTRVTEVDPETGEVTDTFVSNGDGSSYSALFDETTSRLFMRENGYNYTLLTQKQGWANDRLRSKGYLFLNEVLVDLGLDPTVEGQTVGWLFDKYNQDKVSFGINRTSLSGGDFILGYERSVWLDFNVDGIIINKLTNAKMQRRR